MSDLDEVMFCCPEHGPFSAHVPRGRQKDVAGPLGSAGCTVIVDVRTPYDLAVKGRCTRVSPRADIDHDPGDEDDGWPKAVLASLHTLALTGPFLPPGDSCEADLRRRLRLPPRP